MPASDNEVADKELGFHQELRRPATGPRGRAGKCKGRTQASIAPLGRTLKHLLEHLT